MKVKKRQKLCYNCEADVDLDVIVCPFCAADLRAEKPEQQRAGYNPSLNLKNLNTQQALYPSQIKEEIDDQYEDEEITENTNTQDDLEEKSQNIFTPLILLTLGLQLLIFGVFLAFFSSKGSMILKWDARGWFLYLFAGIPFLVFGFKAVSKL